MEGERRTRQSRKPLSDCTNSNTLPFNCNPTHSCSSRTGPPPPSHVITNSKAAASYLEEPISNKKKILIDTDETPKKRRRKFTDPTLRSISTNEGNKENVDSNISIIPDPPSTPSVRQPLSPLDEQLTVYARRQTGKTKEKKNVVVNEAFTCPPVKSDKPRKASTLKVPKCLTELPKKRRIKEHAVSKDYIEQQRAYFAEIDECELPEEEVSGNELSDH